MAVKPRHPSDPLVVDLATLYRRATAQLEQTVRLGLQRGLDPTRAGTVGARAGDATIAYRAQSLSQARSILTGLQIETRRMAPLLVQRAYRAGILATDAVVSPGGSAAIAGRFGGAVHQRAAETFASNMTRSLLNACASTGEHIEVVFERADRIAAGLPVDGAGPGGGTFIGRRVNDPYRSAAVESLGQSVIAGDTRVQASQALTSRLVREGVTDATTGFIDRAGKRWALDTYTEMVARTTTREVMSRSTVNRLKEGGRNLITIPSHAGAAEVCIPYEDQTWALEPDDSGYDVIDTLPPFHVNAVLGDEQVVAPVGRTLSVVRSTWDGPAVEIEGASGVWARVSPNHPVLTARGWLPAHHVRVGDQVLRDPGTDGGRSPVPGQDLHDVPASAAQVFDAAQARGAYFRAVSAADDLHGDARFWDREVDVVVADRQLRDHGDAATFQQRAEQVFRRAAVRGTGLPGQGAQALGLDGVGRPVARPLPDRYPGVPEASDERESGEWAIERESLRALSRPVAVDEVRQVRYLDSWRGHAYDFQTEGGVYFSNGLYTHNCIHVVAPAGSVDDHLAALRAELDA